MSKTDIPDNYIVWPCGLHMAPWSSPETGCPLCEAAAAALRDAPKQKLASLAQRQAGATNGKIGSDKTKGSTYALLTQLGTRTRAKKPRKTG